MLDIGPTFVFDECGTLSAVDWTLNALGVNHPEATWHRDVRVASFVADQSDAKVVSSLLGNEGGAIHVDGKGTVLMTETVHLDPQRNSHTDERSVEAELKRSNAATMPSG